MDRPASISTEVPRGNSRLCRELGWDVGHVVLVLVVVLVFVVVAANQACMWVNNDFMWLQDVIVVGLSSKPPLDIQNILSPSLDAQVLESLRGLP